MHAPDSASPPVLRLNRLGKSFGPVRVLDGVTFDVRAGEVHILAGENGAGKSTLIKIIGGAHTAYDGTMEIDGHPVRFASPQDANRGGIAVIHQELSLIEAMSVADNIALGLEPERAGGWWLDRRAEQTRAAALCAQLGLDLSPRELARPVGGFSMSVRNRIEIAKALGGEARIVVLDEPTSALNAGDVERLFERIGEFKRRGVAVIYITHKMEEIYRIADRITVLRNGRHVVTAAAADLPQARLIAAMLGRELAEQFPAPPAASRPARSPARLEVRDFSVAHPDPDRPAVVRDFSLRLEPGEIVGLAGLQGSGCSELLHALFGDAGGPVSGTIAIDGAPFGPRNPRDAIQRGVALLTADRKGSGLVLPLGVGENIGLAALPRYSAGGWLRPAVERVRARRQVEDLGIRLASLDQPVATLSGGNQQKVALAKWLETQPRLLLLDEPTRGVDVGAKQEIYTLMRAWAAEGLAILFVSTELPELLGLAGRIIVLHRGAKTAELGGAGATAEKILAAAMGGLMT
jgi:ABC-type sugar transport system ATPase subunit